MNTTSIAATSPATSRTARCLTALTASALSIATLLTACSPSSDEAPTTSAAAAAGSSDLTQVDISFAPVADFAPVYIAIEKGFFEEEGLDVQTQTGQNAAAVVPAVLNGHLHFAGSAVPPFLTAVDQGLPIVAVANASSVSPDGDSDPSGIAVPADSDVESAKDLEGHTVAVNQLGSLSHITAAAAINADGGDHTKATFVAMPFPDMVAALERGNIDAAAVLEPFQARAVASGARIISRPNSATLEPLGTAVIFFASGKFADENPDLVAAFRRALDKGSLAAAEDPELVGAVLQEYTNLDPELFQQMSLPHYTDELSPEALQHAADLMVDLGFLDNAVDAQSAVITQP